MDTATLLESLQNDLSTLKTNVAAKGVEVTESDNFTTLAAKVADIESGGGSSEDIVNLLKVCSGISFANVETEPKELPTGLLDLSGARSVYGLFSYAPFSRNVKTSNKCTSYSSMYSGNSTVTQVDLSNLDVSNVSSITSFQNMFYDCASLKRIDLDKEWRLGGESLFRMFGNCRSLTHCDFGRFNFYQCTSTTGTFTDIDVSKLDEESRNGLLQMFINMVRMPSSKKYLSMYFNIDFNDDLFTSLSNYSAFVNAGWSLRPSYSKLIITEGMQFPQDFAIKVNLADDAPINFSASDSSYMFTISQYIDDTGNGEIQIQINDEATGEQDSVTLYYTDGIYSSDYSNINLGYLKFSITNDYILVSLNTEYYLDSVSGEDTASIYA